MKPVYMDCGRSAEGLGAGTTRSLSHLLIPFSCDGVPSLVGSGLLSCHPVVWFGESHNASS